MEVRATQRFSCTTCAFGEEGLATLSRPCNPNDLIKRLPFSPQGCFEGPKPNDYCTDPLSGTCTPRMFKWENHFYRDIW